MSTPMLTEQDASHLRLLSIFHYVVAAMTALFSLIFIIHVVIGIGVLSGRLPMNPAPGQAGPPFDERLYGWMFVAIGSVIVLGGLTLAGFMAYAGRCLAHRRRHLLCLIVAGASCCVTPFGTVLGVFTLLVLLRPSVKQAFNPVQA